MTTIEAVATIAAAVIIVAGGGGAGVATWIKRRNGKAQSQQSQQPAPSQPQVVNTYPQAPPPDFDPAGDTGRHVALTMTDTQRNLPTPFGLTAGEMRSLADDMRAAAQRYPATAQDVDNAVGKVRAELETFRVTTSEAIGDVRLALTGLPCQAPTPLPCPATDKDPPT